MSFATSVPNYGGYGQRYLDRAEQQSNTPYQGFGQTRVQPFNQWQQQGLTATANRAMQGNEQMGQARTALGGVFDGSFAEQNKNPYAGSNPYLQQNIDSAIGDVQRNYDMNVAPQMLDRMQRSGSYGNENLMKMRGEADRQLMNETGRISSNMRFQDYAQQGQFAENAANRNQQMTQFGMNLAPQYANADYADLDRLMGAGGLAQAQDQLSLDDQYNQWLERREYPNVQLDRFGRALGQSGNQTAQTQQPPQRSSSGAQFLGGLLGLGGGNGGLLSGLF